jgi:hypothetical protein
VENALVNQNGKNGHMLIEKVLAKENQQNGHMLMEGSREGELKERLKKMMMNRVLDHNIVRQHLVMCRMQKPSHR